MTKPSGTSAEMAIATVPAEIASVVSRFMWQTNS
jgi:hypothetical protein